MYNIHLHKMYFVTHMDVISDPVTENSSEGEEGFYGRGDTKSHLQNSVPKMAP
jgi:hypothetical protein